MWRDRAGARSQRQLRPQPDRLTPDGRHLSRDRDCARVFFSTSPLCFGSRQPTTTTTISRIAFAAGRSPLRGHHRRSTIPRVFTGVSSSLATRRTRYANTAPLLVLRGRRQRLFDEEGTSYLDTRNNVAHVGHAHPRVARAIAAQARGRRRRRARVEGGGGSGSVGRRRRRLALAACRARATRRRLGGWTAAAHCASVGTRVAKSRARSLDPKATRRT